MLLALVPLAFILFFVVSQGICALNLEFFTSMPVPVGETGGGMANAIVGTLMLVGLGALFAIPIGVISGVYIAEFAGTRLATAVRFAADTLNGVPSIVIGVFVYGVAVLPFKQFSALAGGLALGIMMIPIITRTTEELLRLVPVSLREGALALGRDPRPGDASRSCCPRPLPGIITGIVLALARIAGETAPLLFTAFNNRFLSTRLDQPISSLTVQVFTYAISPYEDWHRQAWAGALVLVTLVLLCSVLARVGDPAPRTSADRAVNESASWRPSTRHDHGLHAHPRPDGSRPGVAAGIAVDSHAVAIDVDRHVVLLRPEAGAVRHHHGAARQSGDRLHRPLRLRQEHVPADAQPDERHHPRRARRTGRSLIDGKDIYGAGRSMSSSCGAGSAWCSRSRTRSRSRSSTTSPTACGSIGSPRPKAQLERRVEESLRGAALWDEVKDRLHDSALALSGGQQQRLCIARALAIKPKILLMDEPASALDPIATQRIEELIYQLRSAYTIVIVTHNMQQAARVSDMTAFFWLGKLVEFDRTEKIFTNSEREAHRGLRHRTLWVDHDRPIIARQPDALSRAISPTLKQQLVEMGSLVEARVAQADRAASSRTISTRSTRSPSATPRSTCRQMRDRRSGLQAAGAAAAGGGRPARRSSPPSRSTPSSNGSAISR